MPRRETFRYSLKAVPLGNVAKPQALTEGVARSRRIGETDYKHKKAAVIRLPPFYTLSADNTQSLNFSLPRRERYCCSS